MGLSGIILKKQEETDIFKLIRDVKEAAEKAGLEPRIRSTLRDNLDGEGLYTTANIADTYEDIPEAQQWLQDTVQEINMHQKLNFSKCRFRINPIIERGKSMQAKDEMMRLNIIKPNRVKGKTYDVDEVGSMLAFFEPLVPIWIDVKLYRYTEEVAEFQLDCSVRLRKPSLLRNQESGHPPFRAVM